MPNIYEYFDLLKFLRDDFRERHEKNKFYSLRAMARRLGVNSGTVVRIINGKRNISRNLAPVFINYLGLRHKEAEYFEHLVNFCQAKSEKVRNDSYSYLVALRSVRIKTVHDELYAFYEEWHYTAVRELLRICDFDGDYRKFGNLLCPKLSVPEVKRSFELLEKLGFIDKKESGYKVRENSISSGEKWQGTAVKRFQKETISKACEALDSFTKTERDFSTMTMCYSEDGFNRVKKLLKNVREELSRIEETDSGGEKRVCQINLQLFPLSKYVDGVGR